MHEYQDRAVGIKKMGSEAHTTSLPPVIPKPTNKYAIVNFRATSLSKLTTHTLFNLHCRICYLIVLLYIQSACPIDQPTMTYARIFASFSTLTGRRHNARSRRLVQERLNKWINWTYIGYVWLDTWRCNGSSSKEKPLKIRSDPRSA
jgi:hypothetical protein